MSTSIPEENESNTLEFNVDLFCKACWDGDVDLVQRYIEVASDPDQFNSKNSRTQTPLYCASRQGKEDVVKHLLKCRGIDVNIQDANGQTALHAASWEARCRIISILLSFGCDCTIRNNTRKTAREEAVGAAFEVWKVFEEGGIVGLFENNYPIWSPRVCSKVVPQWFFKDKEWKPYSDDESHEIENSWKFDKYGIMTSSTSITSSSISITRNSFVLSTGLGISSNPSSLLKKKDEKFDFQVMMADKLDKKKKKKIKRGTWFKKVNDKWIPFEANKAFKLEYTYLTNTGEAFIKGVPLRNDITAIVRLKEDRKCLEYVKYPNQPTHEKQFEVCRGLKQGLSNDFLCKSPRCQDNGIPRRPTAPLPRPLIPTTPSIPTVRKLPSTIAVGSRLRTTSLLSTIDPLFNKRLKFPDLKPHEDKTKFRILVLKMFDFQESDDLIPSVVIASLNSTLSELREQLNDMGTCCTTDDVFKIPSAGFIRDREKVPLLDIPYFTNCFKRNDDPKLLLIRENSPYNTWLTRTFHEINLLIKPTQCSQYYKETDDEASECQQALAKVREGERKTMPKIPINIGSGNPPPSGTVVMALLHLGDSTKTVTIKEDDTADTFLENAFKYFVPFLPPNSKWDDFVLKAVGATDYFVGDSKLWDFDYVRTCQAKNTATKFAIQNRNEVEIVHSNLYDIEEDFVTHNKEMSYSHKTLHEIFSDNYNDNNTKHTSEKNPSIKKHTNLLSVWDIHEYLRIRIVSLDNLPDPRGKSLSFNLTLEIYYGDQKIHPTIEINGATQLTSINFDKAIDTDLKISELPRLTKLCFAVYQPNSNTPGSIGDPIGSINWVIFDYLHQLKSGRFSLKLWKEPPNPLATCVPNSTAIEAITITFEIEDYGQTIVFPTETHLTKSFQSYEPPDKEEESRIKAIVKQVNITEISYADKKLLWRYRYYLTDEPRALSKFLKSVKVTDWMAVQEMYKLMNLWYHPSAIDALELLGASFADIHIRTYAINCLELLSNADIEDYLLQLVQILKFEPYDNSALAQFLLRRALRHKRVGHYFFWLLKSELHDTKISQRFALLLEAFLRGSSQTRHSFTDQLDLQMQIMQIATYIKTEPDKDKALKYLHSELNITNKTLSNQHTELLIDPKFLCQGLVVEKCKIMDSAKKPLWLVFKNADLQAPDMIVIFKVGDDLRQDMLTLQMFRVMDKLWKKAGLNLKMNAYQCIVTGNGIGMLEVVTHSMTIAKIQQASNSTLSELKEDVLYTWLASKNKHSTQLEQAIENFTYSCAGYCVATYVLGIGDRHNDNIMLKEDGHFFHIDFGHFLGNFKKFIGISKERYKFVFTPDMAFVIVGPKKRKKDLTKNTSINGSSTGAGGGGGGGQSEQEDKYLKFELLCDKAHGVLRENANLFINLFTLMLSSGMPELQRIEDIQFLDNTLSSENFNEILKLQGRQTATSLNFIIHNLVHKNK